MKDIHIVRPISKEMIGENGLPRPPITVYYFNSNFIIDSIGQVYFYRYQDLAWNCGTGAEKDLLPVFINLNPNDILQIPEEGLADFVKSNVVSDRDEHIRVSIGSLKDTVESKGLSIIFEKLRDSFDKPIIFFRKATMEERLVLEYKKNNKKYYPREIKWDSTQIVFPPIENVF